MYHLRRGCKYVREDILSSVGVRVWVLLCHGSGLRDKSLLVSTGSSLLPGP